MGIIKILIPIVIIGATVVFVIRKLKYKDVPMNNYMSEGIIIGMSLGCGAAIVLQKDIGIFTGVGMFTGLIIGMFIKKTTD